MSCKREGRERGRKPCKDKKQKRGCEGKEDCKREREERGHHNSEKAGRGGRGRGGRGRRGCGKRGLGRREEKESFSQLSTEEQLQRSIKKLKKWQEKREKVITKNPPNAERKLKYITLMEAKWNYRINATQVILGSSSSSNVIVEKKEEPEEPRTIDNSTVSSLNESMDLDDEEDDFDECVVCMNEKRNATFVHGETGHVACCFTCAKQIQNSARPLCPMCNTPIDSVIKQFFS